MKGTNFNLRLTVIKERNRTILNPIIMDIKKWITYDNNQSKISWKKLYEVSIEVTKPRKVIRYIRRDHQEMIELFKAIVGSLYNLSEN